MASRIATLPRDSHVQSHAAVHKNKLCDSHAALIARAIASGWTRPCPVDHDRQLSGRPATNPPRQSASAAAAASLLGALVMADDLVLIKSECRGFTSKHLTSISPFGNIAEWR
jgi:hypothetical protein